MLKRGYTDDQHPLPRLLNALFRWVFSLERHVVARRALPCGVSLLAIARR